ncbi:putative disease resistance RPP13-like protein 3 isoform X2 [Carex rostrata]
MAEAVTSVLVKLADILREKVGEVQAVRGQIEQVQKELRLIQALLRDVDSKCHRNNVVTEWLNQVSEIANRIATVIDTFRDKIEENRAESSNWVRKITKAVKRNYKKYKLGLHDELENIIEELNRLYQRRTDLRIEDLGAIDDVDDPEACDDVDDPEVVGLEDDQAKIIEQLKDRSISRRMVLSIVGTGGLGKTTLAQKVYNSDKLEGQFDCHAWLSISQTYNLNELLKEILYKVKPDMKKKVPPVTDRDLPVKLKKYFLKGKRYLIILDDVWDINLWGQLKKALPDMYNASRVIITTRSLDVAKVADCNTKPYKLRYLSDNEGLALLFINAFQQQVQPEKYPAHLLDVAKRLTKRCGGLPLALIVLGGILTRRERTYPDWNTLYETIDWHDKDGIQCSQILASSYEDLPRYLKDCFLYFSAFPEDYKISGVHITRMWMAEGFVPKDGAGTIEYRAEKCLEELVQRCLIQVTKKSWNGYCKYCSIHDLLRDLAICKAKDENFLTVFSKEDDVNNLAASESCRAALQFCTPTEDGIYSENTNSLLCFGFGQFSSDNSGFGLLNYSGSGLLQVLTLERVDMTTFTRRHWSKGLIHLRYLGLRDCFVPHDIFKQFSFPNLETIDLYGSEVDNEEERLNLCDVVIPTLRHVYANSYSEIHLPLEWDKHTNLQTIMDVAIYIKSVVELGFCINLRKFGIIIVDKLDNGRAIKEWQNLKSVLKNTVQLVYLSITTKGFLPFGGTKELPCHEKIQKLNLDGKWERNICVPSVEMFPTNLTKLQLIRSGLQEDPMPILERLQSLRILHLNDGSYVGTVLICSTGGFPNLEKLKLYDLDNLHHWDIKEGAMPILRHLEIHCCFLLHVLPELQKVQTLQELTVVGPSRELWEGMQMQGKDVHKIKHIPSVRIRNSMYQ